MKINVDRLCELAGLSSGSSRGRRTLNEASNRSMHDDPSLRGDSDWRFGSNQLNEQDFGAPIEEPEGVVEAEEVGEMNFDEDMGTDMDEVIEVDETELVQELRRAKRLMAESRNRKRSAMLEEKKLQRIIEQEVSSVMSELNLTGGWVYGDRKPRNSRRGHTAQGSYLPGLGFKNRW